ncbi:MAG TPA: 3-oxoacyl-[acyl-carrier-protein] synthase III C-terminal domain-containing protein [Dongiaceae bacterium]|nr:3-oxoacyl-[acyl-carrier-protein] synthase III C-terminal domain-containing protein [Dongiaceae bacterium]
MLKAREYRTGIEITDVATCDFNALDQVDNAALFDRLGKSDAPRLVRFVEQSMGIRQRYFCQPQQNSLDLARSALTRLLERNPALLEEAEFFILAGISNPMPVTTASALLAGEFGFTNVSCWDIKSGCSTGVLAFIQALQWLESGARCGVIICTETLSKFANPDVLQMSAAIGDGAAAVAVRASQQWRVRGVVHGTDPSLIRTMMVKGEFPVQLDQYDPAQYYFSFEQKPEGIEAIGRYWVKSLQDLLTVSDVNADQVRHYIAHQVDASKNSAVASACHIPDTAVARNFADFGNMGCPTVFVNYHQWINRPDHAFKPGDCLVLHAVGGGVSWAGICLEYQPGAN